MQAEEKLRNPPKKRRDNRSQQTRTALIETAEAMFAEGGFSSVSIRQIGAAIGSANNTVVAYHFGNKDGLIEAIYRYRLPAIELRRSELLREAEAAGKGGCLRTLLSALWLPLYEVTDQSGRHSYASFLAAMMRDGMTHSPRLVLEDIATTLQLVDRISLLLPFDRGPLWNLRWQVATLLVLDAIRHIDIHVQDDRGLASHLFHDATAMAIAALLTSPEIGA